MERPSLEFYIDKSRAIVMRLGDTLFTFTSPREARLIAAALLHKANEIDGGELDALNPCDSPHEEAGRI